MPHECLILFQGNDVSSMKHYTETAECRKLTQMLTKQDNSISMNSITYRTAGQ